MKKIITVLSLFAMLAVALPVSAQTTTTTSSLQSTIQALLAQIAQLQDQINKAQIQKQEAVAKLVTTLQEGSSGDAVKLLQAALAADPSIYPEGMVTGYFGALTKQAVRRFQKQNGLEQVGVVGPKTMAKINELLDKNPVMVSTSSTTPSSVCAIVPPGHLIAKGWLKKNAPPVIPTCQTIPAGILKKLSSSTPPTTTPTSTPDIVAPVISNVATVVSSTSVTINWLTNENASTQVMYGTSTALGMSSVLDPALVTSHSATLTGLTATTTYYFSVQSKDGANNLATSSQGSFTTQ